MRAIAKCRECGLEIELTIRKDHESFSKVEVYRHYQEKHPEVLAKYDVGMPYTPVEFRR